MAGATTAAGLGWEHQQLRARLLPYAYGTPCPLCGLVMLRAQRLDLDHAVPRVYGGHDGPRRIVHASCNRRAGQRIASARRTARRAYAPRLHW